MGTAHVAKSSRTSRAVAKSPPRRNRAGAEPRLERGGSVDERRGEADASRTEAQRAATKQAGPKAGAELGPLLNVPFHTS